MRKVVTFGELMLKLSPQSYQRCLQADTFRVEYSGAEANVAVSLANYGCQVSFVSVLPANDIGSAGLNAMRRYGVNTENVIRQGDRMGIYFSEKGASQRPSKVIYDRGHSAVSEASPSIYDWESIFKDAVWFHITGITPALSDNAAEACLAACKKAKEVGITVSCDLNYRSRLWTREKANKAMTEICQYVDICIANETDACDVFGIIPTGTVSVTDDSFFEIAEKLQRKFNFNRVFITLRESINANLNNWSAIMFDGTNKYASTKYSINVVDRIGGGDSFGAGVIYGCIKGYDEQYVLDFATAASCLKHSIEGDFNLVTVSEVENLVGGDGTGRIQR